MIQATITKLHQLTSKEMYVGTLGIKEISQVVKFTNRVSLEIEPLEDQDFSNNTEVNYYQRLRDNDRTYAIKLFLLKQLYNKFTYEQNLVSPIAIFPSAIILACQINPEIKSLDSYLNSNNEDLSSGLVFLEDGQIFLPENKSVFIVDGQHRIAGMESLLEEAEAQQIIFKKADLDERFIINHPPYEYIVQELMDFKFLITYLIDFDIYEQGELFLMVNFTQKPVNKSFYYDIFGSAQRGRTLEKLLHDLTANLNFNTNSPLYKRVKMLGSGAGNFSQAFFIEALMPYFKKGFLNDVYIDYLDGGDKYKVLPGMLSSYFSAFMQVFSEFVNRTDSILLKTTGMGAIILLMAHLNARTIQQTGNSFLQLNPNQIASQLIKLLSRLSRNGNKYFGPDGDFAKGGSKGLQSKLFHAMMSDLNNQ